MGTLWLCLCRRPTGRARRLHALRSADKCADLGRNRSLQQALAKGPRGAALGAPPRETLAACARFDVAFLDFRIACKFAKSFLTGAIFGGADQRRRYAMTSHVRVKYQPFGTRRR
jgi:hypothetical protein